MALIRTADHAMTSVLTGSDSFSPRAGIRGFDTSRERIVLTGDATWIAFQSPSGDSWL